MIHENILYGYDYNDETNELIAREDIQGYGFFSTFTLMLTSLMVIYKKFKKTPDKINCQKALKKLKKNNDIDMYHYFFNINYDIIIDFDEEIPVPFTPDEQHTLYSEKYSKYYTQFVKKYFNFNENIISKINIIKEKYNISSDNSISIIYRDSDKWTDFGGFNYVCAGPYLRKCTEIINNETTKLNVIIQTENAGVVREFKTIFTSTFIEETSLGNSSEIYPPIPIDESKILEWSEYYVAALYVHSQSKYVITYSGNSAFFVYLFRGHTYNLTQEITFTKNYNEFFITNN
jgi:hypothetical protein